MKRRVIRWALRLSKGTAGVRHWLSLILITFFFLACNGSDSKWTREDYRTAATALHQRELYEESIEMYQRYLASAVIERNEIPKVLYQMGILYLERLNDPRSALSQFSILKSLFPDQTFDNQVEKKIVLCLEKLGRSTDAKQALNAAANLNPKTTGPDTGKVIAEVEGRKITLSELEQAVGGLPEATLEKNQLLSQYIAHQLIAESARRKGLGEQIPVKRKMKFAENRILTEEILKKEIQIPEPSPQDLEKFREQHKDLFNQGADSTASPEEIRPRLAMAWKQQKFQEKYQEYLQQILKTDKVRLYGIPSGGAKP